MTFWGHYRSIAELQADRPAVIDQQGVLLTHGKLLQRAAETGAALNGFGLSPGDHIGVFLPNRAAWPILALACAHSGIGVLGLNTRFRHAELKHLLDVAEVDVVVVADHFLGVDGRSLMAELDRPIRVVTLDETATDIATILGFPSSAIEPSGADDHPLIGFTTSGTTGFPKVAMHNQAQGLSHLTACAASFALGPETVAFAPLPLCGAFGYTVAMATLLAGGTVVTHETWDPDIAAAEIDSKGITYFNCSDDMIRALLASPSFNPETTWTTGGFADFTNAGAGAVEQAEEVTGGRTRLTGLYGSSEGFAMMSAWNRTDSLENRKRNGGYLVGPEMEVRCCDPETGVAVVDGQPGELQFRGPSMIDGYLNNPEATAKAFVADGWYRSGDLGFVVEPDQRGHQGFVYLARLGDSLRLRGFLCDPAEIEKHLELHPAVDLAQVVGVKQPEVGDVAVAFVRLGSGVEDSGSSLVDALLEHCGTGLANYKRPAMIAVVDDFPVTDGPNGVKIRKVDLRAQAEQLLTGTNGVVVPARQLRRRRT